MEKFVLLKKQDGILIRIIKICFWIITLIYCYLTLCTIVDLFPSSKPELPSSVSPGKIWLIYTTLYLAICILHVIVLKIVGIIKKKFT